MKIRIKIAVLIVIAAALSFAIGSSVTQFDVITQYPAVTRENLSTVESQVHLKKAYIQAIDDRSSLENIVYQLEVEISLLQEAIKEAELEVEPEAKEPSIVEIIPKIKKGVVHIKCPQWQGSGFVIGPNLIMTARHCLEGVEDFEITTDDEHKLHATRALSSNRHDVGFIYIDSLECVAEGCEREYHHYPNNFTLLLGEHKVELNPLKLGSITECQLGQEIFLIGSPRGAMHFNALTVGYISKLNTRLEDFGCPEDRGWSQIVTIDSVALGGNSGCPVFNVSGQVLGVLVGGPSDAFKWIIPCDLFIDDISLIEVMFRQDMYRKEEVPEYQDPYYNYENDTEYYE